MASNFKPGDILVWSESGRERWKGKFGQGPFEVVDADTKIVSHVRIKDAISGKRVLGFTLEGGPKDWGVPWYSGYFELSPFMTTVTKTLKKGAK